MLINKDFTIEQVGSYQQIPFDLLELADPSQIQVNNYVKNGDCYVVRQGTTVIGVTVLNKLNSTSIEIKNIAIKTSFQGKGFGKLLLRYVDKISAQAGYKKLIIGTGNSSIGQLALYQKEGFEISYIKKNFFVENYTDSIFENGIQCKHMIILEKELQNTQ